MITYLTNSLLTLYLPLWQLWLYLGVAKQTLVPPKNATEEILNELSNSKTNEKFIPNSLGDSSDPETKQVSYSQMDVILVAIKIAPAWFLANCLYNYSLLLTSVSSSTIIRFFSFRYLKDASTILLFFPCSNLAASFTLAFAWFYGLEDVTYLKIGGVVICFVGAVCVGLQDHNSDGSMHTISGDIVALLAAAGYGLYTTMIRRKVSIFAYIVPVF